MSPTPAGVTITAVDASGATVDVTEGVQALYDHLVHSVEWGSGFLSMEDAAPIAELARTCGFENVEEAERYLAERDAEMCPYTAGGARCSYTRNHIGHHWVGGRPFARQVTRP